MILLTGGAGFIGGHLAEALVADGEEAVVLDNFVSGNLSNLPKEVEVVEADVSASRTVDLIAALKPQIVVHAAAQISVSASMKDPGRDLATNVVGTANVLAGAKASDARRFVFLSTGAGIYGECDGADEGTLPKPKSYYAMHKYLAERYVEASGMSHAIARLANVYGPRQRTDSEGGVVAIFAERLRKGLPVTIHGTGHQSRDFLHVADAVDALLLMARDGRQGTWNVATATSTTLLGLLCHLEEALEAKAEVWRGPVRDGDVRVSRLRADKIGAELGWRHRLNLPAGIAKTL